MHATLPMPVLAKGTLKSGRTERTCLAVVDCKVYLADLRADEAPVACVLKSQGFRGPREVRTHDGRLFLEAGTSVEEFVLEQRNNPFLRGGVNQTRLSAICERLRVGNNNDYWPAGIVKAAKSLEIMGSAAIGKELFAQTPGIVFPEVSKDLIVRQKEAFRTQMAGFVAIDGRIFERCGEPLYVVHMEGAPGMTLVDSRRYPDGRSDKYHIQATSRVFKAVDRESALAAREISVARSPRQNERDMPVIEVLMPEVLGFPLAEMDYDRVARIAMRSFAANISCRDDQINWFMDIPSSLLSSWTELRDFLLAYDPVENGVPDGLEEVFERFLECLYETRFEVGMILNAVGTDDIEAVRTAWQNRPIGFEAGLEAGSGPRLV